MWGCVCQFLLETTKICLGSTKLDIFYREKIIFHVEEKSANLKGKRWNIENGRRKGMEMSRGLLCVCVCVCVCVCRGCLSLFA